jgi:hypothetical protein
MTVMIARSQSSHNLIQGAEKRWIRRAARVIDLSQDVGLAPGLNFHQVA